MRLVRADPDPEGVSLSGGYFGYRPSWEAVACRAENDLPYSSWPAGGEQSAPPSDPCSRPAEVPSQAQVRWYPDRWRQLLGSRGGRVPAECRPRQRLADYWTIWR